MVSRVPDIMDALVAGFATITTTMDGGKVTGDYSTSIIYVGFSGDENSQAADVDEQWSGLGAQRKREDVQISCLLVFKDGSEDVRTLRNGAYALFYQVETWLIANRSLGLPAPALAQITSHTLHQVPAAGGYEAQIGFTVSIGDRK